MTIDKAIVVLQDNRWTHMQLRSYRYIKAYELGIEALKRVKEMREDVHIAPSLHLPGEAST